MHLCRITIKPLKKTITYSLLILVLFAFNFKAINYCFKLSDSSIAFIHDCEEKNSESEKSDEKDKKKDLSEYIYFNNTHTDLIINTLLFTQQSKISFSTSDYSMAVYMPPEQTII